MSTKAIREALALMLSVRDGRMPSSEEISAAMAAVAEVDDIEKAAEVLTTMGADRHPYSSAEDAQRWADAEAVLFSVVDSAPKHEEKT